MLIIQEFLINTDAKNAIFLYPECEIKYVRKKIKKNFTVSEIKSLDLGCKQKRKWQ